MTQTANLSPEETLDWRCPKCPNTTLFTGIDAHGYGGDIDEHDDACPYAAGPKYPDDAPECICETELTQDFEVHGPGPDDIEYHAHEGGGSGAEIGSYTTILCRACGATVWTEETTTDAA